MAFDPFLYVAFVVGLVAGRLVGRPVRAVPRATMATIVVLVGLLGASLATLPNGALLAAIPLGLLFAGLVLTLTLVASLALLRARPPSRPWRPGVAGAERFPLSFVLVATLLAGFGLGRVVHLPALGAIPFALYVLLFLVAFDLKLRVEALRRVWLPISAAVLGALGAATVYLAITGTPFTLSLAVALAFGWYTLAGPLVAARAGAALGLVAFLANFLRENLTMVGAPALGRRLRAEGLTALGGATAMDTTLYFVTRYGDEDAGSLALASGLVLTVAASLVLPALLAFAP